MIFWEKPKTLLTEVHHYYGIIVYPAIDVHTFVDLTKIYPVIHGELEDIFSSYGQKLFNFGGIGMKIGSDTSL